MCIQKYLIIIVLFLLIFNLNLFSQVVLQGDVTSAGMDPEPVQNALVELIDQADNTRVFSSSTDEKGHYIIQLTETAIGDVVKQKPVAFKLLQNYPNPFNPSTVITYELPHPADVCIEIYNVLGQKIKTLFDGFQSNLFGRIIWDGTNDLGLGVSAGVYIYSLSAEGIRINKKMLLLDGHSGSLPIAISQTTGHEASNGNVLNKPHSNNFLLRVSGEDIETWERQHLQITGDMVVDVSVYCTVTDIDGNVYRTVKIGDQWWMAENLKVTHYQNGDAIPNVTDNTEWTTLTTGAYSYYEHSDSNAAVYGALYNWHAVNDSRNIPPEGWHVPEDWEWKQLEIYLGMIPSQAYSTGERGTNEGGKLKETGTVYWNNPNEGATNESGFAALAAGFRNSDNGAFASMGTMANFWTFTDNDTSSMWARILRNDNAVIDRFSANKLRGLSVRCVKDSALTDFLINIEVIPKVDTLKNKEFREFTCNAVFSDHSTRDVTNLVKWSLSPGTAGNIDTRGKFTAHDTLTGHEIITATYKGRTAHAEVTVIENVIETGTMTDIDGNTYKTVKIGDQWWMAENLRVTRYSNADSILYVKDRGEWTELTKGAYCYYNNDSSYAPVYGALYNWYAANDGRNIAPEGWHVPTDDEWKQLELYLGMSKYDVDDIDWRGTDEGGKLKETGFENWLDPNTGATNETGFTALPGGNRSGSLYFSDFFGLGTSTTFWTSTEYDLNIAWLRGLKTWSAKIFRHNLYERKQYGHSIRLVRNSSSVQLSRIEIVPGISFLGNSEIMQFNCTAIYSDSMTRDVTKLAEWSLSPGTTGNIDPNGLFTAHDSLTGVETISSTYKDKTAQAKLTVIARETGTVTDIDGNVYKTVKIGDQWWMAENLKVTHYRNGKAIKKVTDDSHWRSLTTSAYCYYDNISGRADIYGALYNWFAINDSSNIAPEGWHVPTDEEWKKLEIYLGMSQSEANKAGVRGTNEGGKLKETGFDHWLNPNTGATNEAGFTARPGGSRGRSYGRFFNIEREAYFWSFTEYDEYSSWTRVLTFDDASITRGSGYKYYGFSVRCVKD